MFHFDKARQFGGWAKILHFDFLSIIWRIFRLNCDQFAESFTTPMVLPHSCVHDRDVRLGLDGVVIFNFGASYFGGR